MCIYKYVYKHTSGTHACIIHNVHTYIYIYIFIEGERDCQCLSLPSEPHTRVGGASCLGLLKLPRVAPGQEAGGSWS